MDLREIRKTNLRALMDSEYNGTRGAQTRLAERLGKPQNFISRCIAPSDKKGSKTIGEDFAREIEKAFQLERYQLDDPEMIEKIFNRAGTKLKGKESNVIPIESKKNTMIGSDEIRIPQFDVKAAMGSGQIPAEYIETIRYVSMEKNYLLTRGICYTQPANLAIITGYGQSMEGTINDGEPVIIDTGINTFTGDGVYVFTWDGMLYIKRLQKASPVTFAMISDNPLHKDHIINIDDVKIHGRAILVWNAKKL